MSSPELFLTGENVNENDNDFVADTDNFAVTEVPAERFAPGTKVLVAADAATEDGGEVYFEGAILGEVVCYVPGDYLVRGPLYGHMAEQFVAPEYLTEVIVVAEPADAPRNLLEAFTQGQLKRTVIVDNLLDQALTAGPLTGKALSWDTATAVVRLASYILTAK